MPRHRADYRVADKGFDRAESLDRTAVAPYSCGIEAASQNGVQLNLGSTSLGRSSATLPRMESDEDYQSIPNIRAIAAQKDRFIAPMICTPIASTA
jgi:hypothetical protein